MAFAAPSSVYRIAGPGIDMPRKILLPADGAFSEANGHAAVPGSDHQTVEPPPPYRWVEPIAASGVLDNLKITEVGFARRGFVRPKHKHFAPILGGVWTMQLAGFDMD